MQHCKEREKGEVSIHVREAVKRRKRHSSGRFKYLRSLRETGDTVCGYLSGGVSGRGSRQHVNFERSEKTLHMMAS